MSEQQRKILCDPQTSGGLLIAVTPSGEKAFLDIAKEQGLNLHPIGELQEQAPASETILIDIV